MQTLSGTLSAAKANTHIPKLGARRVESRHVLGSVQLQHYLNLTSCFTSQPVSHAPVLGLQSSTRKKHIKEFRRSFLPPPHT
jgi:hypothetical protein